MKITLTQDCMIQYTPDHSADYVWDLTYQKKGGALQVTYKELPLEEDGSSREIISEGVQDCHNIFIYDSTHNRYFALHVSPQALTRFYDAETKKVFESSASCCGYFDGRNSCFPAYIALDPSFSSPPSDNVGTHSDSKLQVVIVVNAQYWNQEQVRHGILQKLQKRMPGEIVQCNVIVTKVRYSQGRFDTYQVHFDLDRQCLTVQTPSGCYVEKYLKPFDNDRDEYAAQLLPKAEQEKLQSDLDEVCDDAFKLLGQIQNVPTNPDDPDEDSDKDPEGIDAFLDMVLLSRQNQLALNFQQHADELRQYIIQIEALLALTTVPYRDLGMERCYLAHRILTKFYLGLNDLEHSAVYCERVVKYAEMECKGEYVSDIYRYGCVIAAPLFERLGRLVDAFTCYNLKPYSFGTLATRAKICIRRAQLAIQLTLPDMHTIAAKNLSEARKCIEEYEQKPHSDASLSELERAFSECSCFVDSGTPKLDKIS